MAAGGNTFGQRQPPLYVSIQKILDKYPNGQIFKVSVVRNTAAIRFYYRAHGPLLVLRLVNYRTGLC